MNCTHKNCIELRPRAMKPKHKHLPMHRRINDVVVSATNIFGTKDAKLIFFVGSIERFSKQDRFFFRLRKKTFHTRAEKQVGIVLTMTDFASRKRRGSQLCDFFSEVALLQRRQKFCGCLTSKQLSHFVEYDKVRRGPRELFVALSAAIYHYEGRVIPWNKLKHYFCRANRSWSAMVRLLSKCGSRVTNLIIVHVHEQNRVEVLRGDDAKGGVCVILAKTRRRYKVVKPLSTTMFESTPSGWTVANVERNVIIQFDVESDELRFGESHGNNFNYWIFSRSRRRRSLAR